VATGARRNQRRIAMQFHHVMELHRLHGWLEAFIAHQGLDASLILPENEKIKLSMFLYPLDKFRMPTWIDLR
jgi:hypothetical protein